MKQTLGALCLHSELFPFRGTTAKQIQTRSPGCSCNYWHREIEERPSSVWWRTPLSSGLQFMIPFGGENIAASVKCIYWCAEGDIFLIWVSFFRLQRHIWPLTLRRKDVTKDKDQNWEDTPCPTNPTFHPHNLNLLYIKCASLLYNPKLQISICLFVRSTVTHLVIAHISTTERVSFQFSGLHKSGCYWEITLLPLQQMPVLFPHKGFH